ncbi:MAG: DUF5063 domain-containing protein [Granulosicoccaceae bacterium]|jgi:hypothetical protein
MTKTQEASLNSMADVARRFCEHVEQFSADHVDSWLTDMVALLPQLDEAASSLGELQSLSVHEHDVDDEARFELFTRLFEALGERDGYDYEYDSLEGQRLSGTLADDITDIYFDLKRGLDLLEQYPAEPKIAASDWRQSYEFHWRHHLLDAERQLSVPRAAVSH